MVDKFFVVRVKWLAAGGIKKSELMSYPTYEQAVAKFHSNLATDLVDESLTGSMCSVLNMDGTLVKQDCWGHWVEESPAPEPEDEIPEE